MRKGILFLLLMLLLTSDCWAVIAIVQSTKYVPAAKITTVPFTLTATPGVGNVLIACVGYSDYNNILRTLTPPDANWTKIDGNVQNNSALETWWYVVRAGDSGNYTFTLSDVTQWHGGVLYEFSGVNATNPINQHGIAKSAAATFITTPSVTPSMFGTLPISCATTDVGTVAPGPITLNSVSANWTIGEIAMPQNHATYFSYKAFTTDTTTAQANTFTFSVSGVYELGAIILLAPKNYGFTRFLHLKQ
jgi:hypothetical protein